MPIKKSLPKPSPKAEAPAAKKAARPAKKIARPAAPTAPEPKSSQAQQREEILGPPLQPENLSGASQSALSVIGQTWNFHSVGVGLPATQVAQFKEDGTVTFGGSPGIWRQHGAAIVVELNDRYVDYQGVITGDKAAGTAKNISRTSWTWTAERKGS